MDAISFVLGIKARDLRGSQLRVSYLFIEASTIAAFVVEEKCPFISLFLKNVNATYK